MFAAGVNFALFYGAVTGQLRAFVEDVEFRSYLGAALSVAGLTALLLYFDPGLAGTLQTPSGPISIGGDVEASVRHAVFNVVSMLNSTGYSSMDFNAWGPARQYLLVFAALVGGSAGSTGGGVKVVRWIVVFKTARRELYTTVHPDAVQPVRLGDRVLDERAVRGIFGFTVLYLAILVFGALFIAVDSARVPLEQLDVSAIEALTASLAMIGNIGPGLGLVGPMGGYGAFPPTTKLLMIAMMWVGRLEILPVLVLLTRSYWQS
jgi:trk system potassium uptake protein TrkH